jgi:hypothetical protein
MIGWNPIVQRHITEHPRLQLLIVSTHLRFLSHPAVEMQWFFKNLLKAAGLALGRQPRSVVPTLVRDNLCEVLTFPADPP